MGFTSDNSNWATAPAATAAGESSGWMFTIIEIQAFLSRNLGVYIYLQTQFLEASNVLAEYFRIKYIYPYEMIQSS